MLTSDAQTPPPGGGLPLVAAADLQDHLMVASHDLERLQRLLEDAGEALMGHFYGASNQMNVLRDEAPKVNLDIAPIREALQSLAGAITALQFQDMATQLIAHTQRRLRNCADRIARDAMGDDEDGSAVIGTPDPVAEYHEFGTDRMPPRPFLAPAAVRKGPAAARAIGLEVALAVAGKPPSRV